MSKKCQIKGFLTKREIQDLKNLDEFCFPEKYRQLRAAEKKEAEEAEKAKKEMRLVKPMIGYIDEDGDFIDASHGPGNLWGE